MINDLDAGLRRHDNFIRGSSEINPHAQGEGPGQMTELRAYLADAVQSFARGCQKGTEQIRFVA
jgi:hypothetical protein